VMVNSKSSMMHQHFHVTQTEEQKAERLPGAVPGSLTDRGKIPTHAEMVPAKYTTNVKISYVSNGFIIGVPSITEYLAVKALEEQKKSSSHLKHTSKNAFTYKVSSTYARALHISSHHFPNLPKTFPFQKIAAQFEGFKDGWAHRKGAAKRVMDSKQVKDKLETKLMQLEEPGFTSQDVYGRLESKVEGEMETFQGWRKEYKCDPQKLMRLFNDEALDFADRKIGMAGRVDKAKIASMGVDVKSMMGSNERPGTSAIQFPLTPAMIAMKPQTAMPGRRMSHGASEGLNPRSPWLKNADTSHLDAPRDRKPTEQSQLTQHPRPAHDVVRCTISKQAHVAPAQRFGARPPSAPVHPLREGVRLFQTPGGETRTQTGQPALLVEENYEPPPCTLVVDQDERDLSATGLPRIRTIVPKRATVKVPINETTTGRITPRPSSRAAERRRTLAQLKKELVDLNADLRSKSVNWINRGVEW